MDLRSNGLSSNEPNRPTNPFKFSSRRARTLARNAKNNKAVKIINYSMYLCALLAAFIVFYKFEASHWFKSQQDRIKPSDEKSEQFVSNLGNEKHKFVKVTLGNYGSWFSRSGDNVEDSHNNFVLDSYSDNDDASDYPIITVLNSWSISRELPGKEYGWTESFLMVEPYTSTNFTVDTTGQDESATYTWTFPQDITKYGISVEHELESLGETSIDLSIYSPTSGTTTTYTYNVMVRYVRREVRELGPIGMTPYLEALKILYTTKGGIGRKRYGDNFRSIQEIATIYNMYYSDDECSRITAGIGYLPYHSGLLSTFEKALQSVNPVISVPYWDFTIDSAAAKMANNPAIFHSSVVFNDDYFGAPDTWIGNTNPEETKIVNSELADLKVKVNMWDFGTVNSPHGHVRSPLNSNPSSYVSRSGQAFGYTYDAPFCSDHYGLFQSTNLSYFLSSVEDVAVSTLPLVVGGNVGANIYSEFNSSYKHAKEFAKYFPHSQWSMYRAGYLETPAYCVSENADSCYANCDGTIDFDSISSDEAATLLGSMHKFFEDVASPSLYMVDKSGKSLSVLLLQTLCNSNANLDPAIYSDLTDIAPNDPLFWSIIGTLDRLWHWRAINGFTETEISSESTCYGHNADDTLSNIYTSTTSGKSLTLEGLVAAFDPSTPESELEYIYNEFSWGHCYDDFDIPDNFL